MDNHYNNASFNLWRNILLVNAFLGYCLFYVTRRTCLYSMPMLLQDTALSFNTEAFGLMNSTQMVFYSVGKIICGILADKTRPKIIFTVGLVLVGLINISFGFSTSVLMFIVLQALNGLFQGCGWAPIAVLIKRWYHPTELGTIWAILSATMNISSSVIPLIMATLSDYLHWSRSFIIVGVTAILYSVIAYVSIKDNPSEVCIETDINIKQKNNKALNSKVPFIEIFKSEFIWLMSLSYFIWSSVKSGLEDWLQLYLINERHFSKYQDSHQHYFVLSWILLLWSLHTVWSSCDGKCSARFKRKCTQFSFGCFYNWQCFCWLSFHVSFEHIWLEWRVYCHGNCCHFEFYNFDVRFNSGYREIESGIIRQYFLYK
ncbi:probable hexose phosphate transport protein isoform X2 [Hydractinia symbiolongicarpus]|uniref:probable hexose phosphate transport protein isoform X2 n=1 Tax=Hydractinia symbiolongicarpus TaxID=13093 RepID=UPI00255065A8|nr:probable hexose phosphate transport protein isoform X2 [Hydractinia symbiolongicarpus]